ncbi:hypothetical protein FB007_13032 [Sinorhizobium medicae]|nr:hypothetical protein FB007_13032 [Sinorhizobium medicae]
MTTSADTPETKVSRFQVLRLISRDWLALAAVIFLLIVVGCAVFGPWLVGDLIDKPNFRARNMAPFDLSQGWTYVLGADTLGRSLLARLVVGAQNTIGIAFCAVLFSVVIGGMLGLIAGYSRGAAGTMIMRGADIVMSFPSLLLALIVLFSPGAFRHQSRPRPGDHPRADLSAHDSCGSARGERAYVRERRRCAWRQS